MLALLEVAALCAVLIPLFARSSLKHALLLAGLVSLPFRTDIEIFGGGPGGMSWGNGITLAISHVFFIALGLYLVARGELRLDLSSNTVRAIGLILVACVLSLVNAESLRMTVLQMIVIVQLLLIYYMVIRSSIRTRQDLEFAGRAVAVALVVHGGIGCVQFLTNNNFLLFSTGHGSGQTILVEGEDEGGMMRVFGTMAKPNGYATILGPMLVLNVVLMVQTTRDRFLRVIATALGTSGLVFSFSRGGWLSTTVAFAVYLMVRIWSDKHRRFQLLAGAGFSILILSLLFMPMIEKRMTTDDHNAAMSRVSLVSVALQMIQRHPIVGIGGNNYELVMKKYRPADYSIGYQHVVHNQFLLMFAELGIVGFLGYIWLLASIYREDRMCLRKSEDRLVSAVGLGALLALLSACIHMNVDMYAGRPQLGLLLGVAAIAAAAGRLETYPGELEFTRA